LKGELDTANDEMAQVRQSLDERISAVEAWSKQMVMILFIVFGLLFVVLLIMVILNRSAVNRSFIKLDAKVDNVKEDHALAHKELEKKYMEEIEALRKEITKK